MSKMIFGRQWMWNPYTKFNRNAFLNTVSKHVAGRTRPPSYAFVLYIFRKEQTGISVSLIRVNLKNLAYQS